MNKFEKKNIRWKNIAVKTRCVETRIFPVNKANGSLHRQVINNIGNDSMNWSLSYTKKDFSVEK